jgi:hypothetical protein
LPVAKEVVEGAPVVQDVWQVIGREIEVEASLKTQRTHLYGLATRRPALLLDFAYGPAGLDASVPVGTLYPAALAFYPGNSLRAVVRKPTSDATPLTGLAGLASVAELLDRHATLLSNRPWLGSLGFPLNEVTPAREGSDFVLMDGAGDALRVTGAGRSGWIAMAVSAGKPVSVGVTTDGRSVRLLSIMDGERFINLVPASEAL